MSRVLPILFNTDMVRAILGGRKTVTRRLVKPKQISGLGSDKCPNNFPEEYIKEKPLLFKPWCDMTDDELIGAIYKEPFQPGDILYVRETWGFQKCSSCENCADCVSIGFEDEYKGEPGCYVYRTNYGSTEDDSFPPSLYKWKPSIHMPKEAARIWLKVTDVRVERLQECGKGWCVEIEKEGVVTPQDPILYINDDAFHDALREEFKKLWNSTIKKSDLDRYGWDASPWVWVIEFERCEKPEGV